jgi:hypothetical protein
MSDLDDLFEGARAPRARTGAVVALALGGILLALPGLLCTVLPGTALALGAWGLAGKDRQRLESGYLAAPESSRVRTGGWVAGVGVLTVIGLLAAQAGLLGAGFYDGLLEAVAAAVIEQRFGASGPP